MYRVIEFFTDLHDNDYPYNVGDEFPREGVRVADSRIQELAGFNNKRGIPLIAPDEGTVDISKEDAAANAPEPKPRRKKGGSK